jgi:hypothetical protein
LEYRFCLRRQILEAAIADRLSLISLNFWLPAATAAASAEGLRDRVLFFFLPKDADRLDIQAAGGAGRARRDLSKSPSRAFSCAA